MRSSQLAVKRLADVVAAALVLVLGSPVFIMIAILVKLSSPGPVFFMHGRTGQGGRPFRMFKFRTMLHNAPPLTNPDGSMYTGSDDPRVTKIGRLIRKVSLDELPQFLNVLFGSMSVVGPRPDTVPQRELLDEHQRRKWEMKPGITGWAMVNGRNSIPWKERIDLDIWYIDHYSLWLDVTTALRTVPVLLLGRGVTQAVEGDAK